MNIHRPALYLVKNLLQILKLQQSLKDMNKTQNKNLYLKKIVFHHMKHIKHDMDDSVYCYNIVISRSSCCTKFVTHLKVNMTHSYCQGLTIEDSFNGLMVRPSILCLCIVKSVCTTISNKNFLSYY